MIFQAHVNVMPLKELLDPQGKAVNENLHKMGFEAIQDIRIGKEIVLQIEAETRENAFTIADDACKKLLYNPVMESYEIIITE